jgi:dTMP kinase
VLRLRAFRRLWQALSLSSFGDWLGLLALTALAPRLASGGYAEANIAIAAVFILRLAPAVVIGPLGGVIADRLDRRWTMVVCDLVRAGLFVSIPVVGTLWWLFTATVLIEAASLIWIPAKEATVPNLVPRERLETANQLSLFATYGSAPVAAGVFAGLALLTGILDNAFPRLDAVDLALYVNAVTFLVSALTILSLREIPARVRAATSGRAPGVWRTLIEGWRFVGQTRMVRGLVAGMLGAFAAGGAVIGLARTFVTDLGGGDPGYGLLFGMVFCGLAVGMFLGPRLVPDFSRRRLFGLAIGGAGVSLAVLALVPNLVIAAFITLVIGAWAGIAWVTGYTMLGLEVSDDVRGRTFAFIQTMVRVVLVLVLAVAPLLAAAIGEHAIELTEAMTLTYNGAAFVFLGAGLLAAGLGYASFRHMDDRRGVPVVADLLAAYHNEPVGLRRGEPRGGFFVAFEGGEGAGKSTQVRLLADWLREKGHEVVVTFEPGATEAGRRLRPLLLDEGEGGTAVAPRAEALLFAADRAEHVATVVAPALERGAVVLTDRYVDSSVAYQGAGRELAGADVLRLSRWATDGLRPDITVLLDLPAAAGLARVETPDRLESEPMDFHERVRERFLDLARRDRHRYLVLDGTLAPEQIAGRVRERLGPLLPLSAAEAAAQEEARRVAARREQEAAEERARQERAEADEKRRLAQEAAEEKERQRKEAAEVRARRKRAAEEEKARARQAAAEEKARREHERLEQHRLAEARRQEAARQQELAEQSRPPAGPPAPAPGRPDRSGGHRRQHPEDSRETRPNPRVREDPPTRALSLSDELFGLGSEDDEDGDRTIQLPQVRDRNDR